MNHRLLQLLVCPVCKGPLEYRRAGSSAAEELICHADGLAFPVSDGIPLMLESSARRLGSDGPAVAAVA